MFFPCLPCGLLSENLLHGLRQSIDFVGRIERPNAGAHESIRKRAERTMDVRGAVQSRADGDIERLIENAAEFGRRQCLSAKAQCADSAGLIAMAENRYAVDFAEPPCETLGQFDLVAMNRTEP